MDGDILNNKSKLIKADIDLILVDKEVKLSSIEDPDLMRIKCFSCHEGINANGVEFTRADLLISYKTFIDKPLVISPDLNLQPRGHGYDFKKKKFNDKERIFIGHIVNAYPCIVSLTGEITDVSYINESEYPDGEFRIICEIVVYKQYWSALSDVIAKLHFEYKLKFSMESYCDVTETEDGIQHCTSIHFTGLAIVNTPAFENSYSLEIAEKEENYNMDYEKLYNDEHARVETLVAEKTILEGDKATLISEKEEAEAQLLTTKEELAEVNAKVAEANAEIETLKTYKVKVETAEKLTVGKERHEKLSKYGEVKNTVEELAEISKSDFVDLLAESVEKYIPDATVNASNVSALLNTDTKNTNSKDRLLSILSELK